MSVLFFLLISVCLIVLSVKATAVTSKNVESIPRTPAAYGGNSFLLHCLFLQFLKCCKEDGDAPAKEK